jgi:hypothetical protein
MAKTNEKQGKQGSLELKLGSWVSQAPCAPFASQHNSNSCSRGANCKSFIQDYGFHTVSGWPRCEIDQSPGVTFTESKTVIATVCMAAWQRFKKWPDNEHTAFVRL